MRKSPFRAGGVGYRAARVRPPRHTGRLVRSLLAVILVALAAASVGTARADARGLATAEERDLLAEINRVRMQHRLRPFQADSRLLQAARSHSGDMARKNYFDHRHFSWQLRRYGVRGQIFGENIAWHSGAQTSPVRVVRMWMASPPHRANLLSTRFRRVGVATASGRFGRFRVAQLVTAEFAG